jgi:hypothetical protein
MIYMQLIVVLLATLGLCASAPSEEGHQIATFSHFDVLGNYDGGMRRSDAPAVAPRDDPILHETFIGLGQAKTLIQYAGIMHEYITKLYSDCKSNVGTVSSSETGSRKSKPSDFSPPSSPSQNRIEMHFVEDADGMDGIIYERDLKDAMNDPLRAIVGFVETLYDPFGSSDQLKSPRPWLDSKVSVTLLPTTALLDLLSRIHDSLKDICDNSYAVYRNNPIKPCHIFAVPQDQNNELGYIGTPVFPKRVELDHKMFLEGSECLKWIQNVMALIFQRHFNLISTLRAMLLHIRMKALKIPIVYSSMFWTRRNIYGKPSRLKSMEYYDAMLNTFETLLNQFGMHHATKSARRGKFNQPDVKFGTPVQFYNHSKFESQDHFIPGCSCHGEATKAAGHYKIAIKLPASQDIDFILHDHSISMLSSLEKDRLFQVASNLIPDSFVDSSYGIRHFKRIPLIHLETGARSYEPFNIYIRRNSYVIWMDKNDRLYLYVKADQNRPVSPKSVNVYTVKMALSLTRSIARRVLPSDLLLNESPSPLPRSRKEMMRNVVVNLQDL